MSLPRFVLFVTICLTSLPAFGQELISIGFGGTVVRWGMCRTIA